MEIKISSLDMLKVLVNAGIDAIDAKAIIFDLLQYPDGGVEERQRLKEAKQSKLKRKKLVKPVEDEEEEEEDVDSEEEEEEEEEEEKEKDKKPKESPSKMTIARPKRITFKNFGGAAQPLGG